MGITYADPDRDSDEHTIQIAALTPADNAVIIGNGTAWTAESGGTLRASLGLAIGVDVQAYTVNLDAWANASPSDYLTTVAAAAAYQPLAARLTEIVATGITTAMFATNVVDNDSSLAANSSTRLVTQAAAKAYMDGRIAAQDAMVFVGVIDCSANPNYPAADRGWTYKVSVAGKIGGASGPNVEVGDMLLCITDSTATGNHATVGANWNISQNNVDGAVTGPASSTAGNVPTFNGTSGKVLQDSGFTINQSLATTSSPTFAAVTIAGSLAMTRGANETLTGLKTISRGTATSAADYVALIPTDYGTGKPGFYISKSSTASQWNVSLYDGTNNNGTMYFATSQATFDAGVLVIGTLNVGNGNAGGVARYLAINGADSTAAYMQLQENEGARWSIGFNVIDTSRSYDIYNNGTGTAAVRLNYSTNAVRFPAYGAGTLVTDSSGNITASSDENLKRMGRRFTRGLADMLKMDDPRFYRWLKKAGMDDGSYVGFGAQGVRKGIPEAVGKDPRGFLTLQDRPILAAHHNAILELHRRVAHLERKVKRAA